MSLLIGCEEECAFRPGERMELTVLERVNSWRGECVPLQVGDSFTLTIGDFDCEKPGTKSPLVPEAPAFAAGMQSNCQIDPWEVLALHCGGDQSLACHPTMDMYVSPIIGAGQKSTDKGYLVVRWNLGASEDNDAGAFMPCLDGCEEGFRVRLEMLDR
jgi:hypothetical protein